jgi:hypothetical protein
MKKSSTLWELIIGILGIGIVAQIVCLLFLKRHLYHAVGLWVGALLSIGLAIHMNSSIEDGLDIGGEDGVKHMQKGSVIRLLISCVIMGGVMYMDLGNPLTLLVGVMTLKVAAYLQPTVHRLLEKIRKGGR